MYTKRGGRVNVSKMAFEELVNRVVALELITTQNKDSKTKNDVMAELDEKGIDYNPRDKKEVLENLLMEG